MSSDGETIEVDLDGLAARVLKSVSRAAAVV